MKLAESERRDDPCKILEWDSQFFGFRIAAVSAREFDEGTPSRIHAWCEAHQIRCLYCLRDARDPTAIEALTAMGFASIDIRLTFEQLLRPDGEAPLIDGGVIRLLRPNDLPRLVEIAGDAHEQTRFFADPNFPRVRARELYREWLRRDAHDRDAAVLVAEQDGIPVGYLSCRLDGIDGASISLLGLKASYRSRGLGKALVRAALNHARARGRNRVITVTQGANAAARRVYESAGFRLVNTQVWLHRWFDGSADSA